MHYSEQIEACLRNELSVEDKAIFEEMLRRDPLLKNEFVLQEDIVDAIQNYRKSQLKARLNKIPVDTAYYPANGFKAAGVALAGLLILSTAGWFIVNRIPNATAVLADKTESKIASTDKAESSNKNNIVSEKESKVSEKLEIDKRNQEKLSTRNPGTIKEDEKVRKEIKEPENTNQSDEFVNKSENFKLPTGDITPTVSKDKQGVKVSVVNDKNSQYRFHYSFSDGKLTLYGDFEQLYEILDFNTKDDKQIYLFYQDSFFRLNDNQTSVTHLQKVNNPQLIKTLTEARKDTLRK